MRDVGLRESERFYAHAESSHEVMDVDQDDVLPSLLILSDPSSSGGDLFLSRTGTYLSLLPLLRLSSK
jgi:hypothetical protein